MGLKGYYFFLTGFTPKSAVSGDGSSFESSFRDIWFSFRPVRMEKSFI